MSSSWSLFVEPYTFFTHYVVCILHNQHLSYFIKTIFFWYVLLFFVRFEPLISRNQELTYFLSFTKTRFYIVQSNPMQNHIRCCTISQAMFIRCYLTSIFIGLLGGLLFQQPITNMKPTITSLYIGNIQVQRFKMSNVNWLLC